MQALLGDQYKKIVSAPYLLDQILPHTPKLCGITLEEFCATMKQIAPSLTCPEVHYTRPLEVTYGLLNSHINAIEPLPKRRTSVYTETVILAFRRPDG